MLTRTIMIIRAAVWLAVIVSVVLLIRWFKSFEPFTSEGNATQVSTEITLWVVVALVLGVAVDRILSVPMHWDGEQDSRL